MQRRWEVSTPCGVAVVHAHPAAGRVRATLVLGHGLGGGVTAPDLQAIAASLPDRGVDVLLVEQPWRVAGKRIGGPAPTLDAAWGAALGDIRRRGLRASRLVVGGRSAGARVALRTAVATGADAVLAISFPLHPPGRAQAGSVPAKAAELAGAARAVPTTVVQGDRDPMGTPEEITTALAQLGVQFGLVVVPYANHAMAVPVKLGGSDAGLAHVAAAAAEVVLAGE